MRRSFADGRIPWWLRVLLAVDRVVGGVRELEYACLDRLVCLLVAPSDRAKVTAFAYRAQGQYLPGSRFHEEGLRAWELAAIGTPPFPQSGHILLGAAGGGRELRALCELGYSVTAFEPVTELLAGARSVCDKYPTARVVQGSYADLVEHSRGGNGPFDGVLDRPVDGVVLGLASITHVVEETDRLDLLRALRVLASEAPIFLSYNAFDQGTDTGGPGRRTRAVQAALARLGVRTPEFPRGLGYTPDFGFRYVFEAHEIAELAAAGGYRVHTSTLRDFPHAVLVPDSVAE